MRAFDRPKVAKAAEFLARAQEVYGHALEHIDRLLQGAVSENPAAIADCKEIQAAYQMAYQPAELKPLEHQVSEPEASPSAPDDLPSPEPIRRVVQPARPGRSRR
jgi:hypothetical protein